MENKRLTPQQALQKIRHYCAYQERSHKEVRNRLFEMGLYSNQVEEILSQLIADGFLNEQRFASAFAGGKFRMKKWGRIKIRRELEMHGLTDKCIQIGLNEIHASNYLSTLESILEKKWATVDEPLLIKKKDKVAKFAIAKGYEPDLVWGILNKWK